MTEPVVPWKGPSPGLLGWLMHHAGLLGARNREAEAGFRTPFGCRPVFDAVCPLCSGNAYILGPALGDALGDGDLCCTKCQETYERSQDETFSARMYDEALELVALQLGFKDAEVALNVAERELDEALPIALNLDWPRDGVVVGAIKALDRHGYSGSLALQDLEPALDDCVRWYCKVEPLEHPPRWLVEEVATKLQLREARKIAVSAFDKACHDYTKDSLTTVEICDLEPDAMLALGRVLGHEGSIDEKTVGYLLRTIANQPGELEPGVVRAPKKLSGRTRWQVCRK